MHSAIQRLIENIWYQPKHIGRFFLLPLSYLYQLLSALNKQLKLSQQQKITLPVIVVGNISVGGTGKTPLVIYIAQQLQQQGLMPCIISRGYKGESKTWPLLVTKNTSVKLCGDEAKLIANNTQLPVIVGANRIASIHYAQQHCHCNIIISDDGLQHYALQRNIEIAVIDAKRRHGNGLLLPAGPLREPISRLAQVDLIVSNGLPKNNDEHLMLLNTGKITAITTPLSYLPKETTDIIVMTGIGNPSRFIASLTQLGYHIIDQALFADHYSFSQQDLDLIRQENPLIPIIMTEKDAVKCQQLNTNNFWYLPVTAYLDSQFNSKLLQLLTKQV